MKKNRVRYPAGLTSDVMHVATLLESTSGNRRYAFAVLLLRQGQPEWRTKLFLNSFIKDVDQLVRQNNP
jgi:hypothetical protein